MSAPTAAQVIDVAIKAAGAYHRSDLAARLRRSRARALDPEIQVLVVGEFKQGKSQLVNALVTAPACPVGDDIDTAVSTFVRFAEQPQAFLVWDTDSGERAEPNGRHHRHQEEVPIERLTDHIPDSGHPAARRLTQFEVGVPRAILADGLVLVDTPGVGGLGSAHGAATMAALAVADAVLFVSDASQEYTATELEFLRQAATLCPNVTCVVTKTDLYPAWREIAELDRARLVESGVDAGLIAVSSALRLHAVRTGDIDLNRESGFPELVRYLRSGVVAQACRLERRSAAHDVLQVTGQLVGTMTAELDAQRDPDRARALVVELEQARSKADLLRQRSARWQQTLNDGISDMIADIDHDLRERLREVIRVAELELDVSDPAKTREQFALWLTEEVLACVSATFVWLTERARWLAGQVGDHFADDGGQLLPELRGWYGEELTGTVYDFEPKTPEKFGIGQKVITGMRGGYGGTLMVGMLSTLAGLALINPISIFAGVMLGGKTVREERKRQLQRRQADAKTAVRRHVDDVTFQAGKQCREVLREIQRTLRDHFTAYAEQLHRSLADSLVATQNAVDSDSAERTARIQDLTAELRRLSELERMARQLTSAGEVVPA
jgi:hypothetical protein